MSRRLAFRFHFVAQLTAVLVALVALNLLAGRHNVRRDLTQNKVFEYHARTIEMLRSLEDVVHVTFYNTGQWPLNIQEQEARVRDLFEEFSAISGGRLVFLEKNPMAGVSDPQRQKEVAEDLQRSGIPIQYYNPGDMLEAARMGFFSVRLEYRARQEIIADPGSSWNLEYRVIAAINKMLTPRKTIGVLAPLPKSNVDADFPHLWRALGEIATVRRLLPYRDEDYEITTDIDALLVANPRTLSDATLASIDAHVMRGRPLVYLADGVVPMPSGSQFVPNNSPMQRLVEHYGIRVRDRVAWELSPELALVEDLPARQGTRVRMRNYYKFFVRQPGMDASSPLVRGINFVLFAFVSPLTASLERADTVQLTPLIWTSEQAGVDGPFVSPLPDPRRTFDDEPKGRQVLAMEARGIFPSYAHRPKDPDALPPDTDGSRALREQLARELGYSDEPDGPRQSPPDTRLVVLGGTWFLRDPANTSAVSLIQNILEQVTYNTGLAELRSERHIVRTLRRDLTDPQRRAIKLWGTAALPAAIVLLALGGLLLRRPLRRRKARQVLAMLAAPDRP